MQFSPCFDQALLARGQRAADQLNRVNAVNPDRILIVSMEVGLMVRSVQLRVHADNDTEKAGDFWQPCTPRAKGLEKALGNIVYPSPVWAKKPHQRRGKTDGFGSETREAGLTAHSRRISFEGGAYPSFDRFITIISTPIAS
jgi:hypothetical protein